MAPVAAALDAGMLIILGAALYGGGVFPSSILEMPPLTTTADDDTGDAAAAAGADPAVGIRADSDLTLGGACSAIAVWR